MAAHTDKEILNPKQRRFCEQYVIDLNGKRAAISAGYAEHTAEVAASQMLRKLKFKVYISELQGDIAGKLGITKEKVLTELAKIGFSNLQDYIKTGYTIDEIASLKTEHAAAIESIKVKTTVHPDFGTTTEVSFKLHNKGKALDMISKHIGMYEADNKQKQLIMPPPIIFEQGISPDLKNNESEAEDQQINNE